MNHTTLTLPFPPTVNTYWRQFRGRAILSAKGRAYRDAAALAAAGRRRGKIMGRLLVMIEVYPPDKRRRDLDNLPKGVLDALCKAGVYDDDSQIDDLRIVRRHNVVGGMVKIHVSQLPEKGVE